MSPLIEFIFDQYSSYERLDIVLEIIAVLFGFLSVWYSKQNKILVFPTGMISTSIFVYLLLKGGKFLFLLGKFLLLLFKRGLTVTQRGGLINFLPAGGHGFLLKSVT